MAREFSLCIFKGTTTIYELFLHDDGKMMDQEVYATANIEEGMAVVDMLKQAGVYYGKIVADSYEVNRLPTTELPEFDIEMMRDGSLFRAYKWYKDNRFEATVLESGIDIDDFQENNRLNKFVCINMREWNFDKFEMIRI